MRSPSANIADLEPVVAQMVTNLPAMWEMPVQSLGQEGLLEEGIATHPSILTWKIPRTKA